MKTEFIEESSETQKVLKFKEMKVSLYTPQESATINSNPT